LMGTVLALVILAIAQPFEDFFRKRRGLARKSKER
jgi:hypothetical protein